MKIMLGNTSTFLEYNVQINVYMNFNSRLKYK